MAGYRTVDARSLKCPMPIVKAKKEIDTIPPVRSCAPAGEVLRVIATDPGSVLDFQGWIKASYELVKQEEGLDEEGRKTFVHLVRRKA
jgi:tRNA 2-thiouridine synthesizing protein A